MSSIFFCSFQKKLFYLLVIKVRTRVISKMYYDGVKKHDESGLQQGFALFLLLLPVFSYDAVHKNLLDPYKL